VDCIIATSVAPRKHLEGTLHVTFSSGALVSTRLSELVAASPRRSFVSSKDMPKHDEDFQF
jgi:hypothetical protein